jgi:ATP-dependent Clp protease ATP-binding subunit ClpC
MLPLTLFKFWYSDALQTFIRVWSNSMTVLEEDLAVGLMWKLLFTPLYHDTSSFGRVMSFFFRLSRVITGGFAMIVVSGIVLLLAVVWFVTPFGVVISLFAQPESRLENLQGLNSLFLVLIFGIALFVNYLLHKPLKKVWQIKNLNDVWRCTKVKKNQITLDELLQTDEVKKLLKSLELERFEFSVDQSRYNEQKLLEDVLALAKITEAPFITPAYFFVSQLQFIPNLNSFLMENNLEEQDFVRALKYLEEQRLQWRKVFIWDDDFSIKHLKGVNRGWLGAPTPNLDVVSEDLTKKASREVLEDFIGREDVLNQVLRILSQTSDRNVMLVGEAGSGRSTLVSFLAKKIVSGDAPDVLATKRIVKLDISKLLSGLQNEGEAAQRIKDAFEEVTAIDDVILFFDEFHSIGVGEASKNYNLLALINPYLESSKIQFIASTDPANYAKILEKNTSLARLFHKVDVHPANHDETLKILIERAIEKVRYNGIEFSYLALKEILNKSERLIKDRVLPDSALYVFEESSSLGKKEIISDDVKKLLSERIHVPIIELDSSQKQNLLHLEEAIHQKMIDQEQAVKVIADTLRRAATSIREQNRPIGSFLFVGPTGVGKTELSKILAEIYFKDKAAFVRFDMSEYQTSESVNRLIGTSENPGELTEAIKRKPYCLLLLDEFEKADPRLLTLFLQVLDDGRLTGGDGKKVDFTNTIIIATSNAGSLLIANGLNSGKQLSQIELEVKEELLKQFKPELVNRFDSVVIFKPLKEEELEQIVKIKLHELQLMMHEQGYDLEFNDELINQLAQKGFDPVLGARPLRRLIQDTLEANLSKMILEDRIKKGNKVYIGLELLNPTPASTFSPPTPHLST